MKSSPGLVSAQRPEIAWMLAAGSVKSPGLRPGPSLWISPRPTRRVDLETQQVVTPVWNELMFFLICLVDINMCITLIMYSSIISNTIIYNHMIYDTIVIYTYMYYMYYMYYIYCMYCMYCMYYMYYMYYIVCIVCIVCMQMYLYLCM